MNRHVTRAKAYELCCEAENEIRKAIEGGNTKDTSEIYLKALQGMTDYINGCLNPISSKEMPFIIFSLRTIADSLEKQDPLATRIAILLGVVIGTDTQSHKMSSAVGDAMRAMDWKE